MNSILISILTLATIFSEEYTQKKHFQSDDISVELNIEHGKLNGKYVSKYKNGNKKAEGNFIDNCRMGQWTIWDTSGNVLLKRNYSDPFAFDVVFPAPSNELVLKNMKNNHIVLTRNKEGLYKYAPINQETVMWSKRVWRRVELDENPVLSVKNLLAKTIWKSIKTEELELYDPIDDELGTPLENGFEAVKSIQSEYKITALEIKEDAFFDATRKLSEARIIGIAVIGKHHKSGEEKKLFWLYYPQLRKHLAQVSVKTTSLFEIKHLEDVFHYRDFASTPIKDSGSLGSYFSEKLTTPEARKEALRVEINIIEAEHDWWVKSSE